MQKNYKQKFYDTYIKLLPEFVRLECTRRKMLFKVFCIPLILFFLNIVIPFIVYGLTRSFVWAVLTFSVMLVIYLSLITHWVKKLAEQRKNFSQMMKRYFFNELSECFDFINRIDNNLLDKKKIHLDLQREYFIDDCFKGCYNNVNFTITEYINKNNKDIREVIVVLDFNKLIKHGVIIKPKTDESIGRIVVAVLLLLPVILWFTKAYVSSMIAFGADVCFAVCALFCKPKYETVKLEDNKFHKIYDVTAEDQIEARYLLTTSFMERLKNLKSAFGSNDIYCAFEGSMLTMQICPRNDLFEVGDLFVSVKDPKQVQRFYDEVMAITEIIEHFKLNERLGL